MEMEVSGNLEQPVTPASQPVRRDGGRGMAICRAILKQIFGCVLVAALAYGSFQFVTHYVLQSVQVVGASMSPTLHD